MDVLAYMRRIGHTGPLTPTADTLDALHVAHLRHVPFENLDIHLGNPILLRREALFAKIVQRRRGGFCYELNGLFAWLLGEVGFEVTLLSARDAHEDGGLGPEFDHLTLRVRCPADAGRPAAAWLADVGWGDSFCRPLRLDRPQVTQPEGMRAYRLDRENDAEREDGALMLWQRRYDGQWERQYRFTLEPRRLSDFEPMCRYHQTSPHSPFTRRRICTLATPDGRITLTDDRLIITARGEHREQPVDEEAWPGVLAQQFGISLPSGEKA